MNHYEKMARRVVKDGLTAMALDLDKVLGQDIIDQEVIDKIISGFTNAIMLGLKELLKPDRVRVTLPDELTSNMG